VAALESAAINRLHYNFTREKTTWGRAGRWTHNKSTMEAIAQREVHGRLYCNIGEISTTVSMATTEAASSPLALLLSFFSIPPLCDTWSSRPRVELLADELVDALSK
jgi:hypothetical protein